jgi:Zn-dependent oligopeptidase
MPNRNIREKVYRPSHTRASDITENGVGSDKNNVPYIYEMLGLKKERGRMLGFNSTAEMSIVTKMASSVESVIDFLEMILEKALPGLPFVSLKRLRFLLVQTEERISRDSCLGTSHSGANALRRGNLI